MWSYSLDVKCGKVTESRLFPYKKTCQGKENQTESVEGHSYQHNLCKRFSLSAACSYLKHACSE